MEMEKGGRGNLRMGKPVRKERLVGGMGNRRMGKPVRKGKFDWREGNRRIRKPVRDGGRRKGKFEDGETCKERKAGWRNGK